MAKKGSEENMSSSEGERAEREEATVLYAGA
ncbi:unnamed protein product [Camellia sinensis]